MFSKVGQIHHFRVVTPFRVTDFRPMRPLSRPNGEPNASTTHVQISKEDIDHYINNELKPAGRSMVGAIHSHPGQFKMLSGGQGGDGDIPSMRGTLKRAQSLGWPWKYFLAPIVTFNADHSADEITGWVVLLEEKQPVPARIIFEEAAPAIDQAPAAENTDQILFEVVDHLDRYQARINKIWRDKTSPVEDREYAIAMLRRLRDADMERQEASALAKLTGARR